ncbi:hypothetical protein PMAYCL1PPCAC_07284, partial [Pristionchus mayeri]
PDELEKQFRDSGCTIVFTSENLLQKVMEATKKCSDMKVIICVRSSDSPLPDGIIDFNLAISHPPLLQFEKVSLDDPSLILYSSGTTGEPKGTVISHRSLNANVAQMPRYYRGRLF